MISVNQTKNQEDPDTEEIQLPDNNKPSNPATTTKGDKESTVVKEKDQVSRFIDEGNPNTTKTIQEAQQKEVSEKDN